MFKVGSQLFTAEGPDSVRAVAGLGRGIFLDLKLHDIPNTVAAAVRVASQLPGVRLINVHASGGVDMMRAAADALPTSRRRPQLLAVTILTSLGPKSLRQTGVPGPPERQVLRLALLAKKAGLDGVVTSPLEIRSIRLACGRKFLIVVPGIRPNLPGSTPRDDQSRIASPAAAARAGADYVVVGRPITASPDPVAAARSIAGSIAFAARG